MYWNILDNSRKELLPFLENFPEFYLAGGTALALKIGHRDSIDFDFFTPKDVNTHQLFNKIKQVFSGKNIQKIQEEWGTLTVLIDNVKVSFFQYNYSLIEDLEKTDYFFLASLSDISAMKCNALVGRATMKDYVDIYFLLNIYSLDQILSFSEQKFPELNRNLVLKSMIYFEDIIDEPILYKNTHKVEWRKIKEFLNKKVSIYLDI